MLIASASGRIRGVYGGYSPKLYDAHWVQANAHYLNRVFDGATIIADQHFRSAGKLRKVDFLTCELKSNRSDFLTETQWAAYEEKRKRNNRHVKALRARIESIFGLLVNKWKSLQQRFGDPPEQLDYLLFIACAVYNINL